MAQASILVDQNQFICAVCQDLLKDPVTIPCGHSYCKVCINGCWDQEDQRRIYSCPQCRQTFIPRPVLHRNNMLSEVVERLKMQIQAASATHYYSRTEAMECDSRTGTEHTAFNPYLSELNELQRKFEQRLHEKLRKVEQVKQAVEILKHSAQTAVEDIEKVFIEMIRSIAMKRFEVTELIRNQEKTEVSRAEGVLQQVEQEIADLQRRHIELEQLSHTGNHIHFLQTFQSLCGSPGSEDSSSIIINQHPSFDGGSKSLSELKEKLEEFCREEFNKLLPHYAAGQIILPKEPNVTEELLKSGACQIILPSEPTTREDFLKYFCHFTLDPNTAYCMLRLSEKNRVVTNSGYEDYPDHPERFDCYNQVLSKESVPGRCYWEVERSSNGRVEIAVSYKGIRRKGNFAGCEFGRNKQSWSLRVHYNISFWHNNLETEISGSPSPIIGVYVDHSAGTLSFYNVSDTMTLLHKVNTTFSKPLYAGFKLDSLSALRLCDPE